MRAFAVLSLLAALAFSLFAVATPVPEQKRDLPGVPQIITDLTTKVTPLCNELKALTVETATVEVISGILIEIKTDVSIAVGDVKALVHQPAEVIFRPLVGTVLFTVAEVAHLVAALLCLIIEAVYAVLVVVKFELVALGPVCAQLGSIIAELLTAVIVVVDGLLVVLVPLLDSIVPALGKLSFVVIATVLKIKL